MIVVAGTIVIDPANNERMSSLVATLVPATLAEDGNADYGFWQSPSDAGTWHVFEEWNDEDALNGHFATPHMGEFMGAMGDLGVTSVDIQRYDVTAKSKMM
jgi:quinol monooxygenase YgiN